MVSLIMYLYKYYLYRTAIHTDQNARDATFIHSHRYRVTPWWPVAIFSRAHDPWQPLIDR